jgi:hypothetical protein
MHPSLPKLSRFDELHSLGVAMTESHTFRATAHDEAHDAFMTLPPYTRTREGESRQLGRGTKPCRVGVCVRKDSPSSHIELENVS